MWEKNLPYTQRSGTMNVYICVCTVSQTYCVRFKAWRMSNIFVHSLVFVSWRILYLQLHCSSKQSRIHTTKRKLQMPFSWHIFLFFVTSICVLVMLFNSSSVTCVALRIQSCSSYFSFIRVTFFFESVSTDGCSGRLCTYPWRVSFIDSLTCICDLQYYPASEPSSWDICVMSRHEYHSLVCIALRGEVTIQRPDLFCPRLRLLHQAARCSWPIILQTSWPLTSVR